MLCCANSNDYSANSYNIVCLSVYNKWLANGPYYTHKEHNDLLFLDLVRSSDTYPLTHPPNARRDCVVSKFCKPHHAPIVAGMDGLSNSSLPPGFANLGIYIHSILGDRKSPRKIRTRVYYSAPSQIQTTRRPRSASQ